VKGRRRRVQENKSEIVKRRGVKEEKEKIKGVKEDYREKGEGGVRR
jgi:hypothetical protein